MRSQTKWIAKRQARLRADFMSPENDLRYQHGGSFVHPADENGDPAGLEAHSVVTELKFEDVREHNLEAWAKGLIQLSDELHKSLMGMMFRNLNEVTAKTGNVVNAKEAGSFPQAFLEMMRKIELGVDRDGNVSMPTIAVPPDMAEKQIAELEAQPQEFKDEFELIKQEKIEAALQREAERKARFKSEE